MIKGSDKVPHQLLHLRLGRGREIFRDINFAHGITEISVEGGDGALPTLQLLRCSLERLVIETKAQIVIRLRQIASIQADGMEDEPLLPCLERFARDQCRQVLNGARLPDNKHRLLFETSGSQVSLPIEARRV